MEGKLFQYCAVSALCFTLLAVFLSSSSLVEAQYAFDDNAATSHGESHRSGASGKNDDSHSATDLSVDSQTDSASNDEPHNGADGNVERHSANELKGAGDSNDESHNSADDLGVDNNQNSQDNINDVNNNGKNRRFRTNGIRNIKFPLPSCYVNADGFMCCSKELEEVMDKSYKTIAASRNGTWKKCNIQQVSVAVQRDTQRHFNTSFEVVVGAGDYASRNYFSKGLICKIKRDFSTILAFASPEDL